MSACIIHALADFVKYLRRTCVRFGLMAPSPLPPPPAHTSDWGPLPPVACVGGGRGCPHGEPLHICMRERDNVEGLERLSPQLEKKAGRRPPWCWRVAPTPRRCARLKKLRPPSGAATFWPRASSRRVDRENVVIAHALRQVFRDITTNASDFVN